jgi:hypothetical protein
MTVTPDLQCKYYFHGVMLFQPYLRTHRTMVPCGRLEDPLISNCEYKVLTRALLMDLQVMHTTNRFKVIVIYVHYFSSHSYERSLHVS